MTVTVRAYRKTRVELEVCESVTWQIASPARHLEARIGKAFEE